MKSKSSTSKTKVLHFTNLLDEMEKSKALMGARVGEVLIGLKKSSIESIINEAQHGMVFGPNHGHGFVICIIILIFLIIIYKVTICIYWIAWQNWKSFSAVDGDLTKVLDVAQRWDWKPLPLTADDSASNCLDGKSIQPEKCNRCNNFSQTAPAVGAKNSPICQPNQLQTQIWKKRIALSLKRRVQSKCNKHTPSSLTNHIIHMANQVHESARTEIELARHQNNCSGQADQVKGVLTAIPDIADQTNLSSPQCCHRRKRERS